MVLGLRFCIPNAGSLGYLAGWGTKSHMLQLKILHAITKTKHKYFLKCTMTPCIRLFPASYNPVFLCTLSGSYHELAGLVLLSIRRQDAAHFHFTNETGTLHLETLLQTNPGSGWVRNPNWWGSQVLTQLQHQGPQWRGHWGGRGLWPSSYWKWHFENVRKSLRKSLS